jgi:hypothetical protein
MDALLIGFKGGEDHPNKGNGRGQGTYHQQSVDDTRGNAPLHKTPPGLAEKAKNLSGPLLSCGVGVLSTKEARAGKISGYPGRNRLPGISYSS